MQEISMADVEELANQAEILVGLLDMLRISSANRCFRLNEMTAMELLSKAEDIHDGLEALSNIVFDAVKAKNAGGAGMGKLIMCPGI